jgi:7,8-dihydropterin-6-yl-methyl-4-(beta-D-ribofuranosyl)aminobenzene 5'-phosphate synthase
LKHINSKKRRFDSMTMKLEAVKAAITILVDNTIMELVPDSKLIKRLSKPSKNFIAEHGFAALIETDDKKILVDTGTTGTVVEHNLNLLGLTFDDIDFVFLSHGHNDHSGGLKKFKGKIIAHPDSFFKRYLVPKEGVSYDLTSPQIDPDKHVLEFHKGPVKLAKGVATTGEIERTHLWEELKVFKIEKDDKMLNDRVFDDQGVIVNTANGLVIIAGCSHSGIINTIEQSIELTGIKTVYCVIGGFHLIGPGEAKIEKTINCLKQLNVQHIVPIHCTGFEAIKRISIEMPEEFEYGTTGCRMEI